MTHLNLRHHFMTEPVVQRLRDALEPAGARTPFAGARAPADGRYTQVAE